MPFFLSEILMTAENGNILQFPTNTLEEPIPMIFGLKAHSLCQKLYVIEERVCIVFAGIDVEIKPVLMELRTRCRYFGEKLAHQNILDLLREPGFLNNFHNSSFIIGIAEFGVGDTTNIKTYHAGKIYTSDTQEYGEVKCGGSGSDQFLQQANIPVNLSSTIPVERQSMSLNMALIAKLFSFERVSRQNYYNAWGAGFELATVKPGGFRKLSNLAYLLFETSYDENGELTPLVPDLILHYRYLNNILFITSIKIHEANGAFEGDSLILTVWKYENNVYVVPEFDTPDLGGTIEIPPDFTFSTDIVAQSIAIQVGKDGMLPMAFYSDDGTTEITFMQNSYIILKLSLKAVEMIRHSAKETYKTLNL